MRSRKVRIAVAVLGWLAVAVGAVGVALHFVSVPQRLLVLAASGAGLLMLVAVIGLVLLLVARSLVGAIAAVAVLVVGAATQLPIYVADGAPADGAHVTVMQANILFGGGDAETIAREVRERSVDVLTVEELTPEAVAAFDRAGLNAELPHNHLRPGGYARGTGIWSRYPLADQRTYDDGFVLHQLSATVAVPNSAPVTVVAAHPVPPYPNGPEKWHDEMLRLHDIMSSFGDRPVIVGGDFNATYDHAVFRTLASGRFADAAAQSGSGVLPTYPNDGRLPPVVAIDHVLVAGGRADEVHSVDVPGSDHRAVVASITMHRAD